MSSAQERTAHERSCMLCQGPGAEQRPDLGPLCDGCLAAVTRQVAGGGDPRAALFQVAGRLLAAAGGQVAALGVR